MKVEIEIRQDNIIGVKHDRDGKIIRHGRKRGSVWWQRYEVEKTEDALVAAKARWPKKSFPGISYKTRALPEDAVGCLEL